jgi:hypothetical protein
MNVTPENQRPKVVLIMPAYNAAKTSSLTCLELPHDVVDLVLSVEDDSADEAEVVLGSSVAPKVKGWVLLSKSTRPRPLARLTAVPSIGKPLYITSNFMEGLLFAAKSKPSEYSRWARSY